MQPQLRSMTDLVVAPPKAASIPKNKFPKEIGPQFLNRFMPWVETYWHEYGRYPSDSDWVQKFGFEPQQIERLNLSKLWLKALERRGIARPDHSRSFLNERQIAAIAVITNFNNLQHPVARLADIGVSEEELNGWYSNPAFKDEMARRAEHVFENIAPTATVELGRQIQKGNFQAIKFYYEITGRAASPESLNVKRAMQVLIEAVQKHVKDPAVLQAIAQEVQNVRGLGEVD